MSLTLQVLVTGLAAGGVYGLVAVGQSLVYRLTGIVHFAYGDLVGLGVFTTLLVAAGTGPVTQATANGPRFALALVVGLAVCIAAGIGSYLFAVQPYLARGSTIGWVAATVALAFAIRAVLSAVFTRPSYVFPDPLPFRKLGHSGFVTVGGASLQVRAFFVIAIAVALAAAAGWTLEHSRWGRGLQAIAADAEGARIVGVPVDRLVAIAFGIVGGLAALAAVVAAPSGAVTVDTGGADRREGARRRSRRALRLAAARDGRRSCARSGRGDACERSSGRSRAGAVVPRSRSARARPAVRRSAPAS